MSGIEVTGLRCDIFKNDAKANDSAGFIQSRFVRYLYNFGSLLEIDLQN